MDLTPYQHRHSVTVAAPPEHVYAVVSDVTRMGELSPVCDAGAWEDEAEPGARPGAWFRGHNRIGDYTWETRCRVEAAEPGAEFRFRNCGAEGTAELAEWGYTFTPVDGGTEVTESWKVLPGYPDFILSGDPNADVATNIEGMAGMARDGMARTLANLKQVAEG